MILQNNFISACINMAVMLLALVACKNEVEGIEIDDNGKEWFSPIRIATYNIEFDNVANRENPWSERRDLVKRIFDIADFDIVGVQEPYISQLEDMVGRLSAFEYVGKTVSGSKTLDRELTVTIFYKRERFSIVDWGVFWLSPTPQVPSRGWEGVQYRICMWALMKDTETDKHFYFFNTHFTNRSLDERNASAMLLLDTIPEIVEESPFILAGDFNAGQNSEPYKKLSDSELLNDSYYMTENRYNAAKGTTNQYNPWHSASRIDHVFLPAGRSDMKVESWSIIIDNFENRLPSDHYPVIIELSFSKD